MDAKASPPSEAVVNGAPAPAVVSEDPEKKAKKVPFSPPPPSSHLPNPTFPNLNFMESFKSHMLQRR